MKPRKCVFLLANRSKIAQGSCPNINSIKEPSFYTQHYQQLTSKQQLKTKKKRSRRRTDTEVPATNQVDEEKINILQELVRGERRSENQPSVVADLLKQAEILLKVPRYITKTTTTTKKLNIETRRASIRRLAGINDERRANRN